MSIEINVDERNSKLLAKALQARFAELGIEVKLGQAYEAMAAMAGQRDWNTMKAKLEGGAVKSDAEAKRGPLADALWAAAMQGEQDGTILKADAEKLLKASQGDAESLKELATSCGHVPIVMIDVESEIGRWHRGSGDFLEMHTGAREPFTRETMTEAAAEYSDLCDYTRSATGDFFNDWLYERIQQDGRLAPASGKP